ncbi:MAG TPA: hypothetical protein VLA78_00725 [Paracoccaceae bacterium]|jgi:hypothetical protein|nr:hypothetical protein [Paracoccaceae bacterium]
MDYNKAGSMKSSKKGPKHQEHNAPGTEKNPFGQRPTKAELLERMKAAAEAQKQKTDD